MRSGFFAGRDTALRSSLARSAPVPTLGYKRPACTCPRPSQRTPTGSSPKENAPGAESEGVWISLKENQNMSPNGRKFKPAAQTPDEAARLRSFTSKKLTWLEAMTRDQRVKHLPLRVMTLISFHLNADSGDAFVKQRTLADALGVTRRAVQLAVKAVEELGYVRIEVGTGRGDVNRYAPILEKKGEQEFALPEA